MEAEFLDTPSERNAQPVHVYVCRESVKDARNAAIFIPMYINFAITFSLGLQTAMKVN